MMTKVINNLIPSFLYLKIQLRSEATRNISSRVFYAEAGRFKPIRNAK